MSIIKTIRTLFLLALFAFSLNIWVQAKSPTDLSKSKKTTPAENKDDLKDIVDEVKAEDGVAKEEDDVAKEDDTAEEDKKEKIDPLQTYKIIAIYIIGNQPRALIKNLSTPEELPMEFQVGDYLDEVQTLSVVKISFNPTARVEIVDQSGFGYIIKPKNSDDKSGSVGSKTSYGSMSMPTYFSGGSAKSKSNKSDKAATTSPTESSLTQPPPQTTVQGVDAQAKPIGETSPPAASATPAVGAQTSQALQAVSTGASAQVSPTGQSKTDTTMTSSTSSVPDPTRPSNPFGE